MPSKKKPNNSVPSKVREQQDAKIFKHPIDKHNPELVVMSVNMTDLGKRRERSQLTGAREAIEHVYEVFKDNLTDVLPVKACTELNDCLDTLKQTFTRCNRAYKFPQQSRYNKVMAEYIKQYKDKERFYKRGRSDSEEENPTLKKARSSPVVPLITLITSPESHALPSQDLVDIVVDATGTDNQEVIENDLDQTKNSNVVSATLPEVFEKNVTADCVSVKQSEQSIFSC